MHVSVDDWYEKIAHQRLQNKHGLNYFILVYVFYIDYSYREDSSCTLSGLPSVISTGITMNSYGARLCTIMNSQEARRSYHRLHTVMVLVLWYQYQQ